MAMRRHLPTQTLLVCGALAVVHVLLHLATMPLLMFLAPVSPPLYALAAGIHALMPFLARRLTRVSGSASLTAAIAGVIIAGTNSLGIIVLIPLLLTGLTIDLLMWRADHADRSRKAIELRYYLSAVVLGPVLFAVSLSVFSPEHLTPLLLGTTLLTRVLGELIAAALSGVLARALWRAGVGKAMLR